MKNNERFEKLTQAALTCGADRAAVITANKLVTDTRFRDMCAANACGVYGKCYMCPPDVGEIEDLMQSLSKYTYVLVYQHVSTLEDSFDFEGMKLARQTQHRIAQAMLDAFPLPDALHLSVGGCGVCTVCAKMAGTPCRYPSRALPSLEAYGINVSEMARAAGMKYINGENTVTYFGAVLFNTEDNA